MRSGALALLAYAVVALGATAPALLTPGAVVGGGDMPDYTGTVSFMWWAGFAITHGLDPFFASWDFYPVGQAHLAQYNLLDAFAGAPFLAILGPEQGYDLFVAFVLATTAWAGRHLARVIGAGEGAAFFAGLVLETSSFVANELHEGRLSQGWLLFLLLALAGLVRLFRGEGSWRLAVGTGAAMAATALTYWYYGAFLVIAAIPPFLAEVRRWGRAVWARVALAGGVGLALVTPAVVALARDWDTLPGVRRGERILEFEAWTGGDFGLGMAMRHSPWVGWPFAHVDLIEGIVNDQRLPAVAALLAAVAVIRRAPAWGRWLAVALAGYALSLGPYPRLADGEVWTVAGHAVPGPYRLAYAAVPFFHRFWWPSRFILLAQVGLAALAALGLDRLAGRRRWLPWAAALALLVEQAARTGALPIAADRPPGVSHEVYDSIDGPVLTVPVLGRGPDERHHLWFQLYHQQPILYGLGAHIEGHRPPGYERWIRSNPLLRALERVGNGNWEGAWIAPPAVEALVEAGFRWAVLERAVFREDEPFERYEQSLVKLWGEPDLRGATARAWRIEVPARRVWLPRAVAPPPGAGWPEDACPVETEPPECVVDGGPPADPRARRARVRSRRR